MLLAARSGRLRTSLLRRRRDVYISSSSTAYTGHPNTPLNLDPSLQALLKDVDISLTYSKTPHPPPLPRELEALPTGERLEIETLDDNVNEQYLGRKSPAAYFGSQRIGAVVLPSQLEASINLMISESDRPQLHNDAKRLFYDEDGGRGTDNVWETQYDIKYRSRRQAAHHAERDGTAFASIALPAHYSAIASVFDHIKRRLEATWKVERVIDWGAGTGSGLWASLHSFQKTTVSENDGSVDINEILNSTIATYLCIDKREGLVAIGKRLVRNINLGGLNLSWQKSFKDDNRIRRSDGHDTIALSAFMLTSLPTPQARKALVKEMWESGAHLMVLIDHNTTAGFGAIAEAREYLLKMGRKEFEDSDADEWPIRGSHVVAPCPHDGACPLHYPGSGRLVCGFTQRIQRPAFLRRTKHSGVGHEDIEYSYVVIRRGPRPSATTTNLGRVGEIGKRALDKEVLSQIPIKELILHNEHDEAATDETEGPVPESINVEKNEPRTRTELEEALRLEAFDWPRLVFPPLKKSGHIILDSCTAEGKIMRMTIPKSQGKQAYYDARKSTWGDIFPHAPKNPPQERHQPVRSKREDGAMATLGADIGKRRGSDRRKGGVSHEALSQSIKEGRKRSRRDRVREIERQE